MLDKLGSSIKTGIRKISNAITIDRKRSHILTFTINGIGPEDDSLMKQWFPRFVRTAQRVKGLLV